MFWSPGQGVLTWGCARRFSPDPSPFRRFAFSQRSARVKARFPSSLRCVVGFKCLLYIIARIWRLSGGLGRPNCSGFLPPAEPSLPDQTVAKMVGALLGAIAALHFASCRSYVFDVVFYLISEPLQIDFELPSRPADPQKPAVSCGNLNMFETTAF